MYEAMAFKWKAPKYLFTGVQRNVKDFLDSAYDTSEGALREARYQSASFILGSDHPAAHGRSGGDFVGGFLLWGDIRDCIIRPFNVDPQTDAQRIIESAITALSCSGMVADLAQATPGAPAAIAANGALTLVKLALKRLLTTSPALGVHFVDLIKVCLGNLNVCPAMGAIAKLAKDVPTSRTGVKEIFDALDVEDAVDFERQHPGLIERLARVRDDFHAAASRGFDEFPQVLARGHVALDGWDADTTLAELLRNYEKAKVVDASRAPQLLSDLTRLIQKSAEKIPGTETPKIAALHVRQFIETAPNEGFFMEARYATKVTDNGGSLAVFSQEHAHRTYEIWEGGRYVDKAASNGEIDAYLNSPAGKIRVEVKDKVRLDAGDFAQMPRQLGDQKALHQQLPGEYANEYHCELGKTQTSATLKRIADLANAYKIKIKVVDHSTGEVFLYG